MVEKLRTAVIGLGSMGKNHVRVLSEIRESELVAVSDCDKKKLAEIEKKYKLKGYANYKEMLEKEDLDMVSVVVPTSLHSKVAVDVMNKKINCLVEKPIADTIENAKKIIKAAEKNDVKLTVGHIERFNPAVLEAKKRILANELGNILEITAVRVGPFAPRIRDVGVIKDLTIHDVDTVRFLVEEDFEEVFGIAIPKINTKKEDLFFGIVKLRNNVTVLFHTNWITPTKIRELRIIGEYGMFKINFLTQDLFFYENAYFNERIREKILKDVIEGKMIKYKINKTEPLKSEIVHFLRAIKLNQEPMVSGKIGLENLKIISKFLESVKKWERVRI